MTVLETKVAVVTGASRGIGKGIALALADHGATVYVTGRSVGHDDHELPGTVGETASEVNRRGGIGIAVQVDHADDGQVVALFDQIRREQGRLDILVNNAFALPDNLTDTDPFWNKPLSDWQMVDVGVRSNFVAARLAAELMVSPCHSESDATPCGCSSTAMSRAIRSTALLHIPKTTP